MPDAIVFAGPTAYTLRNSCALPPGARTAWWPPAKRGDVLRALVDSPRTLVLLDGYYHQVPAVTHKELLYALDAGVRVMGAASMGALRAAELWRFGMEGVGRVFEWFRDGVLEGDDEVALLHGPEEVGYAATTVALVEIRDAVEHLEAHGTITGLRGERFVDALKALPFRDRTREVVERLGRSILGPLPTRALREHLAGRGVKARDALAALSRAAASGRPRSPRPRNRGAYLSIDLALHVGPTRGGVTLLDAWNATRVLHPGAPALVRAIRRRHLMSSAAILEGVEPGSERVDQWENSLREALRGAGPILPAPEIRAEARCCAEAEAAEHHFGGPSAALARVAEHLGLDRPVDEDVVLRIVEAREAQVPPWTAARAFAFSTALPAAMALASEARDVGALFHDWAGGARISLPDLLAVAGQLWSCAASEIATVAAARGLHDGDARASGIREALELVAPAERLPRPVNDYPSARERLCRTPLALVRPPPRRAIPVASSPTSPERLEGRSALPLPRDLFGPWPSPAAGSPPLEDRSCSE